MTELRIRNIDDWIVDLHRHNAKRNGTSLETELKRILREAAIGKKQQIAKELDEGLDALRSKYGVFPSSVSAIREDRERLG